MKKIFRFVAVLVFFFSLCNTAQAQVTLNIPFYNINIHSPTYAKFDFDPIHQDLVCSVESASMRGSAAVNWRQNGRVFSISFGPSRPAILHNIISKETLWITFTNEGMTKTESDTIRVSCYYRAHQ